MFPTRRIFRSLSSSKLKNHICTTTLRFDSKSVKGKNAGDTDVQDEEAKAVKKLKKLFTSSVDKEERYKAKENLAALLERMQSSVDKPQEESSEAPKVQVLQAKVQEKKNKIKDLLGGGPKFARTVQESVKEVAAELGGDVKETERDLLKSLSGFSISMEKEAESFMTPQSLDHNPRTVWNVSSNVKDLGIFDKEKLEQEKDTQVKLKIWDDLNYEYLQSLITAPPRNHFQEQIMWTVQGKLWHFPIDNDQGRENEAVDFTEHVFLEDHLEPWCPEKGPLRKFMGLVTVGLSKNHHLTVEEKIEHIHWFRDYFENKKKLLKELGALFPKIDGSSSPSPVEAEVEEKQPH